MGGHDGIDRTDGINAVAEPSSNDSVPIYDAYIPEVGDYVLVSERSGPVTCQVVSVTDNMVKYCFGKPQARAKYGDPPEANFLYSIFDLTKTPFYKLNYKDFDQKLKTRWEALSNELKRNGLL